MAASDRSGGADRQGRVRNQLAQEPIHRQGQAVFRDLERIGAPIEQRTRRFGVVGVKRFEAHHVMARHLVRILDLNRMEGVRAVDNEGFSWPVLYHLVVVFSIATGKTASYFTVAMENTAG